MSSLKKYFLIEPERYNELVSHSKSRTDLLTHPNVKVLKEMDTKIDDILKEPATSDVEKLDQYNSNLDRYKRNFRNAIETSRKDAFLADPIPRESNLQTLKLPTQSASESNSNAHPSNSSTNSSTPTLEKASKKNIFTETLKSIPKSYQSSAARLSKFINSSKDFTMTSPGVLKYKGNEWNISDAVELFKSAVTHRNIFGKQRETVNNFVTALAEAGFPTSSLPYTRMLKALDKKRVIVNKLPSPSWKQLKRKDKNKGLKSSPTGTKPIKWEKFDS